jgi:5-methylcytosine-specific restriction endonuclease McrA
MDTPNDTTLTKTCTKCGKEMPATTEYFVRNKSNARGLGSYCKPCHNAVSKAWRDNNPDKAHAIQHKNYWKNPEKRRLSTKLWQQANPETVRIKKKQWYKNNPEKAKAMQRRNYANNKETIKNANKQYRMSHREVVSQKDKARHQKRYYENPEYYSNKSHVRRVKQFAAEGRYSAADIQELYQSQECRCLYCGIPIFFDIDCDLHRDHVVPISRGGTNYPSNIALACQSCNLSKGDKMLEAWIKDRGW